MARRGPFALPLSLTLVLVGLAFGAESSYDSSAGGDKDASHAAKDPSYADPNPSVFVLGEYFDYDTFVVLLSIVGGCAIVIEGALSKYETWLKSEGDTFQSTLYEKISRELMTLGVVSFALYLLQPVVTTGDLFLVFEFSHYQIFFMAIFTVLQLIALGASTYPIKRRWDIAAYKSKEEVVEGYRAMTAHLRKCSIPVFGLGRVSLDVFHWGDNWSWVDAVQYHIARSVFLTQNKHIGSNFDFARYACLVADRQILGMVNVSLRSWLALLAFRWFWYGLQRALSRHDDNVTFQAWFIFGVILCLLEVSLLYVCMLGMRRVCAKLGADPKDPVQTMDTVLEKIWVAPITHVQHAASVHGISLKPMAVVDENMPYDHATVAGESRACAASGATAAIHGDSAGGGGLDSADLGKEFKAEGLTIPKITVRDAFLVPSGHAYRWAVDILILLNSYYLAFYAVYFISRASESPRDCVWIIVLPLPILCGLLVAYRRVLPLIALLSTIVMMQPTDVADVEDEAEQLSRVRRKLVMRVEDVLQQELEACAKKGVNHGDPEGQSSAAFLVKRWDEDDNGSLSYQELERGLEDIGLVLSSKQRRELFRLADPDRSGSVDVKELTELLFDVEVAMAAAAAEAKEAEAAPAAPVPPLGAAASANARGRGAIAGGSEGSSVNERVERVCRRRLFHKTL